MVIGIGIGSDAPSPRLCHIIKWDDFDGYGFTLVYDKKKRGGGQFIGKIDEDSPAEASGLIEGDRIVEVNGTNICNENHTQVVERIRSIHNETKLLVVDEKTEEYYRERDIVINSTMSNVTYIKTPIRIINISHIDSDEEGNTDGLRELKLDKNEKNGQEIHEEIKSQSKNINNSSKLDFSMSAKEMRAKLAATKKYDARSDRIDLKKKHDIIDTL